MDRKLLDILCCPVTRQSLALLETRGLDLINRAVEAGQLQRDDGSVQTQALKQALITQDRKRVYRVEDGIPVLLAEEAILTSQLVDFPAR